MHQAIELREARAATREVAVAARTAHTSRPATSFHKDTQGGFFAEPDSEPDDDISDWLEQVAKDMLRMCE